MSQGETKFAVAHMAIAAVVACLSVAAVTAQSQGIIGSWEVVESVRKSHPPQEMRRAILTFNKDQTFSIDRGQRASWSGTYRVDPKAGTIDFSFTGKNLTRPHEGDVWQGIFRIQPDGRLQINTAQGHEARPVDYLPGYDLTLMTLKRKN
jgi:uncharacterized protein (TIGR03067 family)